MGLAAPERSHLAAKMHTFERRAMNATWGRTFAARMKAEDAAFAATDFAKYVDDPIGFARDVLGIEFWSRQAEIAAAIVSHDQVAAKTGHKIGKSLMASALALWWSCTRADALVILTAPSYEQVKDIIWNELTKLHKRVRERVGGAMPLDPNTGLKLSNGSIIKGLTTNTTERVAGRSGQAVFVIIDEASGYEDELYEALETSTAGGDDSLEGAGESRILAIGNPTKTSGWFFEIFRTLNPDWSRHTVSSEETPNVRAANDNGGEIEKPIPGLMTLSMLRKLQRKYGPNHETSPRYMVRVLGEYPERSSAAVIGRGALERAMTPQRHAEVFVRKHGHVDLGVDVARFGDDDSAIASRIDDWMEPLEVFSGLDGYELSKRVEMTAKRWIGQGYSHARVKVDGGGPGASCLDALVRCPLAQAGKLIVYDVQASAKAHDDREYLNLRAEVWFTMAEWIKTGALPKDDELARELLAPEYRTTGKNQIQVASKDEIRKVLGRSPDLADAACLAVYEGNIVEFAFHRAQPTAPRPDTRTPGGRHRWKSGGGAL